MNVSSNIKESKETFDMIEITSKFSKIKNCLFLDQAKTNSNILIVKEVSNKLKCEMWTALIFGLLHTGGTSAKASPNQKFEIEDNNKNYFIELKTLRSIWDKITNENKIKFTLRELATTHEKQIINFAILKNLPGNLSKKFTQQDPSIEVTSLVFRLYNTITTSNPRSNRRIPRQHRQKNL